MNHYGFNESVYTHLCMNQLLGVSSERGYYEVAGVVNASHHWLAAGTGTKPHAAAFCQGLRTRKDDMRFHVKGCQLWETQNAILSWQSKVLVLTAITLPSIDCMLSFIQRRVDIHFLLTIMLISIWQQSVFILPKTAHFLIGRVPYLSVYQVQLVSFIDIPRS